jgi:hypothetical protein
VVAAIRHQRLGSVEKLSCSRPVTSREFLHDEQRRYGTPADGGQQITFLSFRVPGHEAGLVNAGLLPVTAVHEDEGRCLGPSRAEQDGREHVTPLAA